MTSNQDFIQQLLDPERAQRQDTFAIMTFSELSDQDTVADIGCGPGYFTIPLAKGLSNGKLYALDIDAGSMPPAGNRGEAGQCGGAEVRRV